jgi:hypothetical protein
MELEMVEHELVAEYLQVLHDNTEASYQKSGFSQERPTYDARSGSKYTKIVVRHGAGRNFQESVHSFVDANGNVYKAAGWRAPAAGVRYRLAQDMELLKHIVDPYGSYLYKGAAEHFLQQPS